MQGFRPWILLSACIFASAFDLPKNSDGYAAFKPHMQAVYSSVIRVMGVLLKDDEIPSGKERNALEQQFKNLATHAEAIQAIAGKSDKGHQVLAAELASNARKAYQHFQAGNMSQTRFFTSDVVSTCFNCHTSRSSSADSRFVVDFQKDLNWKQFEPLSKARFLALSRQFEASAKEYEQIFSSNALSADSLINLDPMLEYLLINIRVRDAIPDVLKTLKALKQEAYPELLKKDLNAWIAELSKETGKEAAGDPLERAKDYMAKARSSMEYPRDRAGLIQFILASKILHEVVRSENIAQPLKAEAYYQLGLAELSIGSSLFADEPIAYFEEAIRLQPKTALAKKAFAQLQENVLFSYTGSSGVNLPPEEKRRLNELRKLAN